MKRAGKAPTARLSALGFATHIRRVYTLPASQHKEVSKAYLNPLRRTFELTTEYGIGDDLFQ